MVLKEALWEWGVDIEGRRVNGSSEKGAAMEDN